MAMTLRAGCSAAALIVLLAFSAEAGQLTAMNRNRAESKVKANPSTVLLKPLPNDTISKTFFSDIDSSLAAAGAGTPKPIMANAPPAEPTKEPWKKLYDAKQSIDMAIGAGIMYNFHEKNTPTPPPTQDYVSANFVAACPITFITDSMTVRAPRCDDHMGSWVEPKAGGDRHILRWAENAGAVTFSVDSAITGKGSVPFAQVKERFTWASQNFDLMNCLGVMRYTVEEKTIKVKKMGAGQTTFRMHDTSKAKEAFFLRYVLKHPNGSIVAQTQLFRENPKTINITTFNDLASKGAMADGPLLATVSRQGNWKKDEWKKCTGTVRDWKIDFKQSALHMDQAGTVFDLRVAVSTMITLMALRDETRNAEDGLSTQGSSNLIWSAVGSWVFILCMFLVVVMLGLCFVWSGAIQWLRRRCFQFEASFFPKRTAKSRQPAFHTTW